MSPFPCDVERASSPVEAWLYSACGRHGRFFEAKPAAAYDAVKAMRIVPIGNMAIVPIAAAAAAPMLAVLAIQVPVAELLLKLLKALV